MRGIAQQECPRSTSAALVLGVRDEAGNEGGATRHGAVIGKTRARSFPRIPRRTDGASPSQPAHNDPGAFTSCSAGPFGVWVISTFGDCGQPDRLAAPGRLGAIPVVKSLDRVRLRLDRICRAASDIDQVFLDTPVLPCAPLGEALGCSVTLKVETLNPVRSFKGRGTETAAAVARAEGAACVVCASAGNLGQALAYSGVRRGLEVTVVAASTANPLKVHQIAALGADVRLEGEDIEDARWLARDIAESHGAYLVEDSLDLATCEGAATIGLELVRDDPQLEVVLVAVGGGAMASGVGYVARSLADHVEVIGIQPAGAPAMALSWRQGMVVETDRIETIADGVAGRCPIPAVLDDLLVVLDDVVLVSEDSIRAGMRALYEHAGLVVEPSAALGVAAVLENRERFAGRRVTTILCGSNVGVADFARWVLEPAARNT